MDSTPQTKKQKINKTKNDAEYKRAGKGSRAIIKNISKSQERNNLIHFRFFHTEMFF